MAATLSPAWGCGLLILAGSGITESGRPGTLSRGRDTLRDMDARVTGTPRASESELLIERGWKQWCSHFSLYDCER